MKKLTFYILSFIFVFLVIILSCERKRFDNPYDPKNRLDPPQLLSPQDGEICDLNPPFFEWEYLGEKAGYEIEIDTLDNFGGESVFRDSISESNFNPHKRSLLFANAEYYWRVRATVDTGISPLIWSEWSKTNSFRVRIPIISTFMCSLYINDIKAVDSYVLISDQSGCLRILDFSDVDVPVLISNYNVGNGDYYISKVSDQLSYLYDYSYSTVEIVLLETADFADVKEYYRMFYTSSNFTYVSLTFSNFLICICEHMLFEPDSVVLFDVSNPDSVVQSKIMHSYNVNDLFLYNNTLFLSTGSKIYVYDINQIQNPVLMDSLIFQYYVFDFLGEEDDYLYVETSNGSVEVFDIRDPIRPVPVGSFSDNVSSNWGGIENGYLTGYYGGYYRFYSLSSPLIPQLMGGLGVEYECSVSENHIFSWYYPNRIKIFEINE